MDTEKTSSTDAVRAAISQVQREQGGTTPAGGNFGAGKHTPGVAEGMTGPDLPGPSPDHVGWAPRRNFTKADNVSYVEPGEDGFLY